MLIVSSQHDLGFERDLVLVPDQLGLRNPVHGANLTAVQRHDQIGRLEYLLKEDLGHIRRINGSEGALQQLVAAPAHGTCRRSLDIEHFASWNLDGKPKGRQTLKIQRYLKCDV
jgi:hypothetical protein